MKIVVNSKSLLSAVSLAEKCMRGKTLIEILNNFVFELGADGMLTVSGTNLEISGVASVQTSEHEGEGRFLVDAKKFSSLLKTFSDQPLSLSVDAEQGKSTVRVTSSGGKYEIVTAGNIAEYPESRNEGALHTAFMDKGAFLYCLNAVAPFAAPEDDLRLILTGVHISIHDRKAEFAATDAHVCCYVGSGCGSDYDGDFTIPSASANVIRQALKDGEGSVNISWTEDSEGNKGFVSVSEQGVKITTRLTDSDQSYPNYRAVYPSNFSYSATINKADLVSKLKRLMVCSDSLSYMLKLRIDGNAILMRLDGTDNGFSGAENITPSNVGTYAGAEPMEIGVNIRQMILLAENTSGEDLRLDVVAPSKPLTISDTDEDGVKQIVMPLFIS